MSAVQDFIASLEGELRTGGGATLDELYDLAVAIQEDLEELSQRLPQTNSQDEPVENAPKPSSSQAREKYNE